MCVSGGGIRARSSAPAPSLRVARRSLAAPEPRPAPAPWAARRSRERPERPPVGAGRPPRPHRRPEGGRRSRRAGAASAPRCWPGAPFVASPELSTTASPVPNAVATTVSGIGRVLQAIEGEERLEDPANGRRVEKVPGAPPESSDERAEVDPEHILAPQGRPEAGDLGNARADRGGWRRTRR